MNSRNRKKLYGAGLLAVYILLIVLLTAAESGDPDATIHTIPEAVWYSLTTMTTVGYGDLYPVTAAGRLIGAVFQLLSLGILALIVGTFVLLMKDRVWPRLIMKSGKNRSLFIFTEVTPEAEALAGNIRNTDPDCLIIFSDENRTHSEQGLVTVLSAEELLRDRDDAAVFCMSTKEHENIRRALSLSRLKAEIYCLSEYEPEHLPENVILFSPCEITARLYWHTYPLTAPDERIVLIGDGRYAEELLEQGLMGNVIDPAQHVSYSVIGDYTDFRRNHPGLAEICSVDETAVDRDSVCFFTGRWNEYRELLQSASRIIVCTDSEEHSFRILAEMKRYVPLSAPVHARMSADYADVTVFGTAEELWTPEMVMRRKLSQSAMRLNDIYRAQTGGTAPEWKDLNSFTRRSNLASADHLETKIRILLGKDSTMTPDTCRRAYKAFTETAGEERDRLRMIEHERWMRFHILNGWSYAPVRDNAKRHHRLLVDFGSLSPEDQEKDDYAWEILKDFPE